MTFVNRQIVAQFDLGEGQFGTSGSTRLTLEGLRMNATITQSGIPDLASVQADIYGMTLSQMNQLTTLGQCETNPCGLDAARYCMVLEARARSGRPQLLLKT